jgi:hypothetical protein
MPPEGEGGPLSAEEIGRLRAWVDTGAAVPPHEPDPPDPRAHWAFRPPRRPPVPRAADPAWALNPIDAFLAAGHESHGLHPSPPAPNPVLLRRVSLDLTGFAPSPAELREFLDDPAENAYEKVVDRLLSSPRHGERWGRHWMDVWRYSDWDGYGNEVRESQPHLWHWRDWIIESLNADAGYDRMVVAMLAADEAAPGDQSALRATGYIVRSWYKFNRNVWLDNAIEHTSKAFLGLTINCARCHDHKYDPIPQRDYYRLRAVFEPYDIRTDPLPGEPDPAKHGLPHVYDARPDAPTHLFLRGDEKRPETGKPLKPGVPELLGREGFAIRSVSLPIEVSHPGLRRFVREELLSRARVELEARRSELSKAAKGSPAAAVAEKALVAAQASLTAAEARVAADLAKHSLPPRSDADLLARLAALAERQACYLNAEARLARAGDRDSRTVAEQSLVAARAALSKTDSSYTPLGPSHPTTSTGRRLALARWRCGSRRVPTR